MNSLDATLHALCPTVMVPRHSPLCGMAAHGHRFLTATDGLYLEARRSWMHWIAPIAPSCIRLPYGAVSPSISFSLDIASLVQETHAFVRAGRRHCPLEHAAWIVRNNDGQLQHRALAVERADAASVRFGRADIASGEALVVDIHSHGLLPAFFSSTDDEDDLLDDCKLAVVVGNLDQPQPTVAARLVGLGVQSDVSTWFAGITGLRVPNATMPAPSIDRKRSRP